MTLTPEQIKEAIELAGSNFYMRESNDGRTKYFFIADPVWHDDRYWEFQDLPAWYLAALASQLISQVDAMDDWDSHVIVYRMATEIRRASGEIKVRKEGPNRDENSILACTEFLREKGNE